MSVWPFMGLDDIFPSCTKMRANRAWKIIKTGRGI